ncbi:hypothetical protein NBRC116495_06780 [Aurantivibrio plasticivorans]
MVGLEGNHKKAPKILDLGDVVVKRAGYNTPFKMILKYSRTEVRDSISETPKQVLSRRFNAPKRSPDAEIITFQFT